MAQLAPLWVNTAHAHAKAEADAIVARALYRAERKFQKAIRVDKAKKKAAWNGYYAREARRSADAGEHFPFANAAQFKAYWDAQWAAHDAAEAAGTK